MYRYSVGRDLEEIVSEVTELSQAVSSVGSSQCALAMKKFARFRLGLDELFAVAKL